MTNKIERGSQRQKTGCSLFFQRPVGCAQSGTRLCAARSICPAEFRKHILRIGRKIELRSCCREVRKRRLPIHGKWGRIEAAK